MTNATTRVSGSSPIPWGVALAAVSLLVIGGGLLFWTHPEPAPTPQEQVARESPKRRVLPTMVAPVPVADVGLDGIPLHELTYAVENGNPVVKIRVLPDGDELIVDAKTGRLLESRPSRPTAPPPMGKFAAPFAPMT